MGDITKNLRKGKEEGLSSSASVIQPRNSNTLFSDRARERKPMSNLNGGSNPSINSSTRSLNKSATLNATRQNQRSTENVRNARNVTNSNTNGTAATISRIGNKQPTSSKENLSRSSSSASRSSVTNSMSRNGSVRTGVTSPTTVSSSTTKHHTLPLPRSKSTTLKNDDIPSYMKPTAARTKKVLGGSTESQGSLRKTSINKMSTSSRVTPVAPRPSRR